MHKLLTAVLVCMFMSGCAATHEVYKRAGSYQRVDYFGGITAASLQADGDLLLCVSGQRADQNSGEDYSIRVPLRQIERIRNGTDVDFIALPNRHRPGMQHFFGGRLSGGDSPESPVHAGFTFRLQDADQAWLHLSREFVRATCHGSTGTSVPVVRLQRSSPRPSVAVVASEILKYLPAPELAGGVVEVNITTAQGEKPTRLAWTLAYPLSLAVDVVTMPLQVAFVLMQPRH